MNTAVRTALAIGQREAHRTDHANITIQRTTATTYMVVVEYGSTGARVDELTSGPYTAEEDARNAARNAYRAFKSGRTVQQVKLMADDAAGFAQADLFAEVA